jgi:hypothetical protein
MKANELLINGQDAWTNYRVKMGSDFLNALEADADNKDYITNTVRSEHGTRVVPLRPKKAERNVTLEFVIIGTNHNDYNERLKSFDKLMDNGFVTLQVPSSNDDIYRLYCARKSTTYSRGKGGAIGKKSIKFVEYDPTNRGELTEDEKSMFSLREFEEI